MGNSVSLAALSLTKFEGVNSFFGTRQAVKWLWMLLAAHICCVEAYKNNHPLLASEIILAKPRIRMKLCQWKSATASISLAEAILGRWRHAGGRGLPCAGVPVRRRRVRKSLMLSGLAQAPPWQHGMLNLSTSGVPLRPSPNPPGPPNCATTEQLRTTGLVDCSHVGWQPAVVKGTATW